MEGPNKPEQLNVNKEQYMDLVNDFGIFIGLNAARLDQQIIQGKESELLELQQNLRKPILNGLNYSSFVFNNHTSLLKPHVAKALLTSIYQFIQYIEPRLDIFKDDSAWKNRFEIIKDKYINLVSKP